MQRRASRIVMCALVVLIGGWSALLTAQSMPKLPPELTLPQSGDSPGKVAFRHETHVDTDKPSCTTCHPKEFRILRSNKAKRPAITHQAMEKGRFCGSCHNGKKAFALDDCTSCHAG